MGTVAFTAQASLHTMMILHLGVCCLVGLTLAAPLQDTPEVLEAKEKFLAAFATAETGGLKHMQAVPIANFYIAKVDEVAAAEADFMKKFESAEKGEHIKYAPVNNDIQLPQIG